MGVVSLVTRSDEERPESEVASRTGAAGVAGAVVSMATLVAAEATEVFQASSVALAVNERVPAGRVDAVIV